MLKVLLKAKVDHQCLPLKNLVDVSSGEWPGLMSIGFKSYLYVRVLSKSKLQMKLKSLLSVLCKRIQLMPRALVII